MPNKDYLIVLDLDGTLLKSNKEISLETKNYLSDLNKKGYKITLASGRPARNILKFQTELNLNSPVIALNGLHIHYPSLPNKDKRIYFSPTIIKKIVELVQQEFKIKNIICETDKEIYITDKNAYLDPKFWLINMKVVYGSLEQNLTNPVMTFIIELADPNFDRAKLHQLFKDCPCQVRCWEEEGYRGFIEIYNEHSNKARAIINLAKEMNVDINNVFAFGDDLNDIEMLRDLPNAYAMLNSTDYVKRFSHHITHFDNEHDGVIKELEIILKNLK